ncbi:MAG: hypothetical protein ACE5R4_10875 [Armatimonadota bacterium]
MDAPTKPPILTARRFLLFLAALALASLALSLIGRTGKAGMMLFFVLFLLTAVLCLPLWGAMRCWRKGRRRMLQYLHIAVNVIQGLLDYSPGIGLIFTNPEHHVFNVYAKSGQGQIEERQQGGRREFRYRVLAGQDPLRYAGNPEIAAYMRDHVRLSDQHWLELTFLEHYPDAMRRVSHSFENENSASMHVVGADGWDFAPYYVAKHVLVGSHGSLNNEASLVPVMFSGPGIKRVELPYARTVDVVPTILKYFDVEAPAVDGRALPVFEDPEKNRAIRNDVRNVFWKREFEDGAYLYRLEHMYASYDRRIVRIDKETSEREVLVESIKEALPELEHPADTSLELSDFRDGKLIFRTTHVEEALESKQITFDVGSRSFE